MAVLFLSYALLSLASTPLFAQQKVLKDAKAYSWYIRNMRYQLQEKHADFQDAFGVGNVNELNSARWRYFKKAEEAEANLKNLQTFEGGDQGLKQASIALISFYKKMMKEDYLQIVNYFSKEDMSQETIQKIKSIIQKLSAQEKTLYQSYLTALRAFENAHGLPKSE